MQRIHRSLWKRMAPVLCWSWLAVDLRFIRLRFCKWKDLKASRVCDSVSDSFPLFVQIKSVVPSNKVELLNHGVLFIPFFIERPKIWRSWGMRSKSGLFTCHVQVYWSDVGRLWIRRLDLHSNTSMSSKRHLRLLCVVDFGLNCLLTVTRTIKGSRSTCFLFLLHQRSPSLFLLLCWPKSMHQTKLHGNANSTTHLSTIMIAGGVGNWCRNGRTLARTIKRKMRSLLAWLFILSKPRPQRRLRAPRGYDLLFASMRGYFQVRLNEW